MTPQWNADIITPDEKGSGTQVIGDNQQVQTTLESGENITIEDGKINASGTLDNVQADWTQSDSEDPSYIKHKPNLATVATSGDYGDLSNRPDLSVYATTSEVADKADKVSDAVSGNLAGFDSNGNLADSGVAAANLVHDASYVHTDNNFSNADVTKLSGIEAGAEVNVQANWSQSDSSADDFVKNKPDLSIYAQSANLATVATSGSYNDLSDKPTIPSAVTVDQTYSASSANAQSGTAVAGAISTKQDIISDLATIRTGAGLGASAVQPGDLATVATSGSYNDLTNKPSIPAAQVNSDWDAVSGVSQILNKPNLATVATTGSYEDLSNKPTIPAAVTVDQHYDAQSSNAQSGVAVAEAIAGTGQVPTVTSADDNKVLMASYSGGVGSFSWEPTAAATQVNADWDATSGVAKILNKPDLSVYAQSANLATVAISGNYNDLSNRPSIPAAQVNSDWDAVSGVAQILNKPNLAAVATSGDYADLSNKPTIPAEQVQSNWNELSSSSKAYIQNKPDLSIYAQSANLATVATSGSYNDLSDKPTIPAAVTVDQTYNASSANAQSGVAVAGAISTKQDTISDLATIRSGAAAGATAVQPSSLATVATTGDYADLQNKPSIPAAQVNSDWNSSSGVTQILNKPALAAVATTGDYADLVNKPSIPAAVTVDQTYNASSSNPQSGTAVAEAVAAISVDEVPTVTSNDDGKVLKATYENGSGSYGWESEVKKPIVAGANITITNGTNDVTIAATDTTYTFSTGLTNNSGTITVTNPVPAASSSDQDKVLGVTDSSGTLGWVAQTGGGGGNEVPDVTSSDDGKILKASYSEGTGSYDWAAPPTEKTLAAGSNVSISSSGSTVTISATDTTYTFSNGLTNSSGTVSVTNPIPSVTSSDDGKVLQATYSGGSGSFAWTTPSGGGNQVPAVTSNDDGKVLQATYSGGTGSYAWATPSGGGGGDKFVYHATNRSIIFLFHNTSYNPSTDSNITSYVYGDWTKLSNDSNIWQFTSHTTNWFNLFVHNGTPLLTQSCEILSINFTGITSIESFMKGSGITRIHEILSGIECSADSAFQNTYSLRGHVEIPALHGASFNAMFMNSGIESVRINSLYADYTPGYEGDPEMGDPGADDYYSGADCANMFNGCSQLRNVDISGAHVNGCYAMFKYCVSLNEVPCMSQWEFCGGTFIEMFYGCTSLLWVPDISCYHTTYQGAMDEYENGGDTSNMFYNCKSLMRMPYFSGHFGLCTSTENMYQGCSALTSLKWDYVYDLGFYQYKEWDEETQMETEVTQHVVTNVDGMFYGCSGVIYGAVNMYNNMSSNWDHISSHNYTFRLVGADVGSTELSNIPSAWQ